MLIGLQVVLTVLVSLIFAQALALKRPLFRSLMFVLAGLTLAWIPWNFQIYRWRLPVLLVAAIYLGFIYVRILIADRRQPLKNSGEQHG
jgi:hypothetical protein